MNTSSNSTQYALGLDFGTLSARAAVVSLQDGHEAGSAIFEYPDGVIDSRLPGSGVALEKDAALQNPDDYLAALEKTIPAALQKAGVTADAIVGIGVDFTSCTTLPVLRDGTPLCRLDEFRSNPHAWVKLWKHHTPQPEADEINALAGSRGEEFLGIYGGKYSSEWFFSKLLETVRKAPDVYGAADRFIEAGDWLVWMLTGQERRCISAAGFKAMVVYPSGNPDSPWTCPPDDFFRSLDPALTGVADTKLGREYLPLGASAGGLAPDMAQRLGLNPGTPVAAANIDAHVAVPACRVSGPGTMVMIMGTSTCHLLVSGEKHLVEGMCGVVRDGVLPGFWGYEAGQSGVGDSFAWFIKHACPAEIHEQARQQGSDVYQLLADQAAELRVGESGLLALDWWNGNRSVLVDADLTGLILGLSVTTRPHEIYRALIESTAFGTRRIIEAFTSQGVDIHQLVACGGLARKNPLMMQIYADVTGMPIRIAASDQTCALGAAMYGAMAAGHFSSITEAASKMAHLEPKAFHPDPEANLRYGELYKQYIHLHDYFGRSADSPMKTLKSLRRRTDHS